ncbi:putative reverse transcriptase domain-containing protein [Tanacetum coccineum]
MAHSLMDQIVRAKVAKNVDNKRKWEDNQRVNFGKQQNKRLEVVKAYNARPNGKKGYVGTLPYCNRTPTPTMNLRILGTCFECGEKGHFKNDCPKLTNQNRGTTRGRAFVLGEGKAR